MKNTLDDRRSILVCHRIEAERRRLGEAFARAGFLPLLASDEEAAEIVMDLDRPLAVVIAGDDAGDLGKWFEKLHLNDRAGLPLCAAPRCGEGRVPAETSTQLIEIGFDEVLEGPIDEPFPAWRFERLLQQKKTSSDLARLRASFSVLQSIGRMGVWEISLVDASLHVSKEAAQLFALPEGQDVHSIDALLERVIPENEEEVRRWLESQFEGQEVGALEYIVETDRGEERRLRLRAGSRIETGGEPRVIGAVRDVTGGLDPREIANLADATDPVTGLPNRRQFLSIVDKTMSEACSDSEQLAVLFIEVDAAPGPNDLPFTEEEREEILVTAVQRLKECMRDMDVLAQEGAASDFNLARVGGETLTALLREQKQSQDAFKVSRRLREVTEQSFVIGSRDIPVDLNIGIAVHPGDAESALGLVKCAEDAMYCAKQQGRNNIQFFTNSMNTATFEALTLESSLRRALDRNELLVHYQPKVEIATNKIVGMEALVRWKHPELGLVSPAQFIPVAEETGLIIPIGEYVLRTACQQNRDWQDMGFDSLRMAVNISSIQFRRPDLFDTVVGVLDDTRLDAEWLELEITESILLENVDATISTLQQLKRAGIHLSIDDFGTGYSSLSYLKRFPVDTLKVDQSFIREVTTNPDDASITTSIILMGHSLKLKVIAEGVETKSQLAFLRVLECDEVQGYYYSPPVSAERATELLAKPFAVEA
ncbi:MAG: phosphodiesterase [Planctomycetota bacterium]